MTEKIAYLFDSSSCYQKEDPDKHIYLVPCNIVTTTKEGAIKTFEENNEISQEEIIQLFLDHEEIKTALVNPEVIKKKVLTLLETYDKVYFVPISYAISGTYEKALPIVKEINTQFHKEVFLMIKSNAVMFLAQIVMQRFIALYNGTNFEETQNQILQEIEANKYCGFLLVNNLDTLIKGGRIKKAKGFVAKLLNFKLLILMGASLEFYDKALSYNAQIQKVIDFFNQLAVNNHTQIESFYIMFDGLKSTKDKYLNELKLLEKLQTHLNLTNDYHLEEGLIPGCIKVHTGLNSVAIIAKLKID